MAGDVAGPGIEEIGIGDTLRPVDQADPLAAIRVDDPTISMVFQVNNSPLAGLDGDFVTSRHVLARLDRALTRDVALRVKSTDSADSFEVCGRGVMHLSVLIEEMRREGFEFAVGPRVILKDVDGRRCEPTSGRPWRCRRTPPGGSSSTSAGGGELLDMNHAGNLARVQFKVPARGLIGARTALLTLSQGEAVLSHVFDSGVRTGGRSPGARTASSSATARARSSPTASTACRIVASSSSPRASPCTRA